MINTINTLHKLIKNRFDINTQSLIDDAVYKIREYVIEKESVEQLTEQQIEDLWDDLEAGTFENAVKIIRAYEKIQGIE